MTISTVAGTVVGGNLTSIQVTGTSIGCDQVEVSLRCSANVVKKTVSTLAGTGNWAAVFTAADIQTAKCFCQKSATVSATCVNPNNPQCVDTKSIQNLPCAPPCCNMQVQAAIGATCSTGKRKVTLDALNNCPATVGAQWDFGDGSPLVSFPIASGATQSVSHFYLPGNYTAVLHVPGCPDQQVPFTVDSCCPTAVFNDEWGNCNADGTQPATITAVIAPPAGGAIIQANLVEGNTVLASGTSSGFSSLSLVYSGTFPSGSHTVCVRFTQPAGCADQCATFAVNCTGACCLPDGTCADETTQKQCENQGGTYKGHGAACKDVTCTRQPPPECVKTFRRWFCPLLCGLMTFLTAIGLVLLLFSTCPYFSAMSNYLLYGGLAFIAAGVLALVLYWIFCTKCVCGWFYLFLWRVLFGAGLVVTVFSRCCSILTWVGLGMILFGLFFLFLWRNHCNKTLCAFLGEILLVMSVVLIPVISYFLSTNTFLLPCVLYIGGSSFWSLLLIIIYAPITAYHLTNCSKP
jgi:hypothetical protein